MKTLIPRRILLVEDEVLIRSFLVEFLTKEGFEVSDCSSAVEAIKLVDKFDPDAIVSDIDLGPGANGIELITNLIKSHPHLAGVILSNYSAPNQQNDSALKKIAFLRKRDVHDKKILLDALESVLAEKDLDIPIGDSNPLLIEKYLTKLNDTFHDCSGFSSFTITTCLAPVKAACSSLKRFTTR